jgi:hypothetical protein
VAGVLLISYKTVTHGGALVSIGSQAFSGVVEGAKNYIPEEYIDIIPRIFDEEQFAGEDGADARSLNAAEFNCFYVAIRKSMERYVRRYFDSKGIPRKTKHGDETMSEIVSKLESDLRFDGNSAADISLLLE